MVGHPRRGHPIPRYANADANGYPLGWLAKHPYINQTTIKGFDVKHGDEIIASVVYHTARQYERGDLSYSSDNDGTHEPCAPCDLRFQWQRGMDYGKSGGDCSPTLRRCRNLRSPLAVTLVIRGSVAVPNSGRDYEHLHPARR